MLNGIKAVLSGFIERKDGIFVNVSSIAGVKAFPNHAVYCATKFALHGFTETIRQETAKHGTPPFSSFLPSFPSQRRMVTHFLQELGTALSALELLKLNWYFPLDFHH